MLALLSYTFLFITLPILIFCAPLHARLQSIGTTVDPSTDEWASTLSGVGPLILLIGDRTTKQVLRNVRSVANAFSLAAAPLGLISVVTSLIRFCGTQKLRAFIGYELEARSIVGMEVTRVNCAGVSAQLADGYVMRSIAANPASQLVAVSILNGSEESLRTSAVQRIRVCEKFDFDKRRAGIPGKVANLEWCMNIVVKKGEENTIASAINALADAVGVDWRNKRVEEFRRKLVQVLIHAEAEDPEPNGAGDPGDGIDTCQKKASQSTGIPFEISTKVSETGRRGEPRISVLEVRPTLPVHFSEKPDPPAPFWDFTFMSTFDAVSEFTTSNPSSRLSSTVVGIISCMAILTVHVLALYENGWVLSIGWILVLVGYGGIVLGVLSAALLMHASCACINLETGSSDDKWKNGMVVSVKNTDSMDTTGSDFITSSSPQQTLEAVWIKPSTGKERTLASLITLALVASFIAHYLGLRAVVWWDSVAELCICIIAAFARSVSNDQQPRFQVEKEVKIDKRCRSTGLIKTQSASLVDDHASLRPRVLDARAYSPVKVDNSPAVGERLAFQIAKQCIEDPELCNFLIKVTNMTITTFKSPSEFSWSILVSFTGGILVSEGLVSPESVVALAFRSKSSDLAAPTPLLARGIMRQAKWRLDSGMAKGIPLGNVYLSSLQSMLDWWTLSEDRNDMGDLQKNLHWSMFLINVAFFISVKSSCCLPDGSLWQELVTLHGHDDGNDKMATEVVGFLKQWSMAKA